MVDLCLYVKSRECLFVQGFIKQLIEYCTMEGKFAVVFVCHATHFDQSMFKHNLSVIGKKAQLIERLNLIQEKKKIEGMIAINFVLFLLVSIQSGDGKQIIIINQRSTHLSF